MSSLLVRSLSFALLGACASGVQQPSDESGLTGSDASSTTGAVTSSSALETQTNPGSTATATSTVTSLSTTSVASSVHSNSSADCTNANGCSNTVTSSGVITSAPPSASNVNSSDESSSTPDTAGTTSTNLSTSDGTTHTDSSTTTSDNVDPDAPVTIWLAGDSTVANGNTPCPTGWGKHLAEFFNAQTSVRNSAAGGRSVRTWAYNVLTEMDDTGECELQRDANGEPTLQSRWQDMLDNMKAGDFLFIQFGINDGSATCDRHVGLNAFKETYGVLADAAKERGAQPVFLTPVSSIGCSGNTPVGTRGAFVDVTIEAGTEFDVPVLDLHARSVERYTELGFCPVSGGDVSADTTGAVGDFFCDDHTHFSESGAVDIASLVVELLMAQNISVVSHLK